MSANSEKNEGNLKKISEFSRFRRVFFSRGVVVFGLVIIILLFYKIIIISLEFEKMLH